MSQLSTEQTARPGQGAAERPLGRLWHRPLRAWPLPVSSDPIVLPAPPVVPADSSSIWMMLVPALGGLSVVAFAFVARSLAYLVVALVLVVVLAGSTVGTRFAQVRQGRRRHAAARQRFEQRLGQALAEARTAAARQRDGLLGLYPDPSDLTQVVRDGGCFERRSSDPDFGAVRLGLGPVPAARPVVVEASGVSGDVDPDLGAAIDAAVAETQSLPDAPVVVDLARRGVVGVVGEPGAARDLVAAWVASLAGFHAPTDLRLHGVFPVEAAPVWEWTKWLPHTRDPLAGEGFGRTQRTVTTDRRVFEAQLTTVLESRSAVLARAAATPGATSDPIVGEHVVVVVDGYQAETPDSGGDEGVLGRVVARARELHVTCVLLATERAALPANTDAWVEIDRDGRASYRTAGHQPFVATGVLADRVDLDAADELGHLLAPLRLAGADAGADLVDTVRLVDLLGLDHAGSLEPRTSWTRAAGEEADTDEHLLSAPIGVAADGSVLRLDLREAAAGGMGPHGILVGATGSGKSELLRSLTTALAATHDPALLNVVLVDFKGGAAFAGLDALPHVAGMITNLEEDLTLVDRVRAALHGELERRQELLRAAGNLDSIRDYHAVAGPEGMPYLLVVVDEFGELLAARPEFLDTFLTLGRLGRSLGVHLLLSTQRLDEGRIRGLEPHLRYRICLRTFSAAESQAVLGTAAAFELPPLPGLGLLKVDTTMTRFKAALATTPHRPPVRRLVHTLGREEVVRPFELTGAPFRDPLPGVSGEQAVTDLQVLVERMAASAERAHQVWLPPLPSALTLADVFDTIEGDSVPAGVQRPLRLPVGVVDLPERQRQEPLVLDLSGPGGNVAIVGAPRTGKTTFLTTFVTSLAAIQRVDEAYVYCLDLVGGGLHALTDLPHVGAVVSGRDGEMVARLLRELRGVVADRAAAMRRHGVSSLGALRQRLAESGESAADVFLVVDGVGLLRAHHPEQEFELAELAATGLAYGVHVVLAAGRWLDVRPALLDAIGTRLELRLNDPIESQVGRAAAAAVPVDVPGRGLTRSGQHFQVALPMVVGLEDAASVESALRRLVATVVEREGAERAPSIRPLPAEVRLDDLQVADSDGFLLGISEFRFTAVQLDLLRPGAHLYAVGDPGSGRSTLLHRAARHLLDRHPGKVQLHLVDPGRQLLDLADAPGVASYAVTASAAANLGLRLATELAQRQPPADLTPAQLRAGSWWSGPQHVLVVDDYDLLLSATGGPFAPLLDLLALSSDIGLHVLLARRASGAQRSQYEPFGQRLRELCDTGLVMAGPPNEGPLFADRSAAPLPPGRGYLVRRGSTTELVQCCLPPEKGEPAGADGDDGREA